MANEKHPIDIQFCYLTTIGRTTGLPREIEIWFVERAGRLYILSEHGYKAHWVKNIIVNALVEIRIQDRVWTATGWILDAETGAQLYLNVRELALSKYGWGEGLPVEFRLGVPVQP